MPQFKYNSNAVQKSDDQTSIDKYRVHGKITEYQKFTYFFLKLHMDILIFWEA